MPISGLLRTSVRLRRGFLALIDVFEKYAIVGSPPRSQRLPQLRRRTRGEGIGSREHDHRFPLVSDL
jgi:hypothetical protein